MKVITDERCLDYAAPGHPESPQRVAKTLARLRSQSEVAIEWLSPGLADPAPLRRAHDPAHLATLGRAEDFDGDTPAHPGIETHARRAVGGALLAMEEALQGSRAMSLLRPPGHHATKDRAMGFCYLNQVAVAALEALSRGLRVAVYDFDVHHGNGTEDILLGRPGAGFFSIHQWPCYPGTGRHHRDNCMNWPMPPETPRLLYRDAFQRAFDALIGFGPDLIAISAGFDAFRGDPIAQERVEIEDYEELGTRFAATGIPTFAVLEGGYSAELPELVLAFLRGFQ